VPRIARGAKYIFGWSKVGGDGRIVLPDEALEEYGLGAGAEVVLVPGSKASGGFGISPLPLLKRSRLSGIMAGDIIEGKTARIKGRPYSRARIIDNGLDIGPGVLAEFGVQPGDRLLAIRSSGIAIGMAVRGPIIEEAGKYPEIKIF
jgi:bifunctional DNA-binding transcriptional regulator/antitoxin component of YhaV-PrlF toxin-antitoxin module